jgi:hypothetical protein
MFLIALQLETFMWHSPVGCWGCYNVVLEHTRIFWSSMAQPRWSGMLQYGIRASIFNIDPGWADQVELKRNFIED